MELGPIQKQWIQNLRDFPDRQTTNLLGFIDKDNNIRRCCLGEYLCVYNEANKIETVLTTSNDETRYIHDKNHSKTLYSSFEVLGLHNEIGKFYGFKAIGAARQDNLASMNDGGWTWSQIADFIEKYKDDIFTKSI